MRNRRLIAAGLAVLLAFPIGLSNISAEAAEVMSQSGNNSDSYKKVTVDPGSGYSIVETEDYTAVLPKGYESFPMALMSVLLKCWKKPLIPATNIL